jgi:hypothetical protein
MRKFLIAVAVATVAVLGAAKAEPAMPAEDSLGDDTISTEPVDEPVLNDSMAGDSLPEDQIPEDDKISE